MFDDIKEKAEKGILPGQWLRAAVQDNVIRSEYTIPDENYQPASLDLRLGEKAHILQCSFLPYSDTVEKKLRELAIGEIDIRDGAILEKSRPYLIPLLEDLHLPPRHSRQGEPQEFDRQAGYLHASHNRQ